MILNVRDLINDKEITLQEDLIFNDSDLSKINLLKKVNKLNALVKVKFVNPFIIANLKLKGDLILLSSRSLKEVPFSFEDEIDLTFSLNEEDLGEDIIYVDNKEIDFNPYLFDLLEENIPLQIIADNEAETLHGDSWEVIQEEEYNNRKKDVDNPFASLKKLGDE